MSYGNYITSQAKTPANKIPDSRKEEMFISHSGAALFKQDKWSFLRRCLVTGTSSNFYYAGKFQLTSDFAAVVEECAKEDANRCAAVIKEVSYEGIAVRVDSCIFALLVLSKFAPQQFLEIATCVIRTQSHFHLFMSFVKGGYRGMGKTIQTFGKNWFQNKKTSWLSYQAIKYPQRNGFSVRDELRLFHPKTDEPDRDALFSYVVGKDKSTDYSTLETIKAYEWLKANPNPANAIKMIEEYNLSHEMVAPLGVMSNEVWSVLFQSMPLGATIRNLANLSSHEVFDTPANLRLLKKKLTDKDELKRARIHPFDLLLANKVYRSGKGVKSEKTWVVKNSVALAIEEALMSRFDTLESTGQTYFFAIDVSHSMSSPIEPSRLITCAEVATTMALASAKAETDCYIYGFKNVLTDLGIFSTDSFSDALRKASKQNFGSTNAGVVFEFATKKKLHVDTFVFFTDGESFGGQQNFQLLDDYRKKVNRKARAVYCTLAPYRGGLNDPKDPGSLSIEGFDPTAVRLIQDFSQGNI
jgi:60 kDa SS-A/Ro ribonucleoprotein